MKTPYYYEVHEGDVDGVKVIAICGSEEDARMMMGLSPQGKTRSWVKCQFLPPNTVDTKAVHVETHHLPYQPILEPNTQEPLVL
jgi:hypothetical protein